MSLSTEITATMQVARDAAKSGRHTDASTLLAQADALATTHRARLEVAQLRAELATLAFEDEPCAGCSTERVCTCPSVLALEQASEDADAAVEDARRAYRESDEPRTWTLTEDGQEYGTCEAGSVNEALEEARDNVDGSNYGGPESTVWIDVRVHCEDTDEAGSDTVVLQPEAPECTEGAHDWQSPHEIVGGCPTNPGVRYPGTGAGVVIEMVCMHCGCASTTRTDAQRPDTGQQFVGDSVSYEPGKWADEVAALREAQ